MEEKDWKVESRCGWTFKHNHGSQKRQDILPREAGFYHRGPKKQTESFFSSS